MPDFLDLLTADGLAAVGRASVASLWLPLLAWTAFSALGELTLRLTRPHAMVAVRVRSALLLALPLALLVPPALAGLFPDTATAVAAARPPQLALPEFTGIVEPSPSVSPPMEWVLVGLATVSVVLASAWGLLRWAGALMRLRRVRDTLAVAPEPLHQLLKHACQRLGIHQPVEVAYCEDGVAPFTFGWRRPVIAVPPSLTGEPLRLALAHELAHVRHHDFLWNALEQGVSALGSAHPLVRLLARGATLGREQAADADVLAGCPSERRAYADLLLSYASRPAPQLTLGATQGSSFLHTRIAAMTRTLSSTRLRQLATAGRTLGALAVLLLVGAATALAVPEAAPSLTPPEWLEGRVTDATSKTGIAGASLLVVDTQIGAATDAEGAYRLKRPEGELVLRVSAPGYTTHSIPIGADQSELDVELRPADGADAEAAREAAAQRIGASSSDPPSGLGAPAPDVYVSVETPPQLIGGLEGLQSRLVYPELAQRAGIEGRVFVTFIVDEEGRVQDPTIAQSPDPMLSEAALQAVRASEFIPGRQRGVAVKVRYALPLNFRLPAETGSDGQDRGANRLTEPEASRVWYAGVELALLENEAHIRHLIDSVPSDMTRHQGATGTAEVRYILQPDGSFTDVEVVSAPRDGELARLTKEIAERMILAENRRPPTARTGMFRLDYR